MMLLTVCCMHAALCCAAHFAVVSKRAVLCVAQEVGTRFNLAFLLQFKRSQCNGIRTMCGKYWLTN
eukprot:1157537-Pelagomonas_calceolata.AAC.5